MTETWDISLLIDTATKIHDARGMTGRHLGVEVRNLPDRAFIDFVDPENRGPFRRRLVKMIGGTLEMARVRLITASEGSQEFFAAVKKSQRDEQWWLMLAARLRDETPPLAALEKTGLAEGDEFMMLLESAARQLSGVVDLVQVRAAFLQAARAGVPDDVREQLQAEFSEIVVASAYDNIATSPQPGEYLVLKDRAKRAEELLEKLSAAAERRSISAEQLGLQSTTVAMEELNGDFSQANINGFVYDLRNNPDRPAKEWELDPEPRSWVKPVISALSGMLAAGRGSRTSR